AVFVATHLAIITYWGLFNALRKMAGAVRPGQTLPDMLLATFVKGTAILVLGAAIAFILVGRMP
ncbi:MAG: hypothetical protein LPK02_10140, partial [Rhodobacterales bacterium]|nr:hypothetical protein [Rhodobacterales bacterium]MDX5413392.1 hypothetical protein [Rhodobacterales bacterium]